MAWFEDLFPYDPVRPQAKEKTMQELLEMMMGSGVDIISGGRDRALEYQKQAYANELERSPIGPPQRGPGDPIAQPTAPPQAQEYESPDQFIGPPQPPENLRAEQMWAQFQEMNPNLDYDAVVQQAGGIPGSFDSPMISEMPDSPERQAQVASLMDYVQNQIPRDEIARKQDPRSRAYDPGGAAQLIAMIKLDQEAGAMSAEAQIEKIKADAQMKNATAYETLAGRGQTAGGYPFGGQGADVGGVDSTVLKQVEMAVDSMSSRMTGNQEADDIIMSDIAQLKMLVAAGRLDEARKIYEKYAPRNPETAMPPPGVSELAGAEGSRPVAPTSGKYTTNPATGELVYVG